MTGGGWAAIVFAVGASLDFLDEFGLVDETIGSWMELCASLCWLVDWLLCVLRGTFLSCNLSTSPRFWIHS